MGQVPTKVPTSSFDVFERRRELSLSPAFNVSTVYCGVRVTLFHCSFDGLGQRLLYRDARSAPLTLLSRRSITLTCLTARPMQPKLPS